MDAVCCYPAHAVMTVHISLEINFQSWLVHEKKLVFFCFFAVVCALEDTWYSCNREHNAPGYVLNDAINYLLIHVYLMTRKAVQVNYSHWPEKNSLNEVVHFCPLADVLQYHFYKSNGKLNDAELRLRL